MLTALAAIVGCSLPSLGLKQQVHRTLFAPGDEVPDEVSAADQNADHGAAPDDKVQRPGEWGKPRKHAEPDDAHGSDGTEEIEAAKPPAGALHPVVRSF